MEGEHKKEGEEGNDVEGEREERSSGPCEYNKYTSKSKHKSEERAEAQTRNGEATQQTRDCENK